MSKNHEDKCRKIHIITYKVEIWKSGSPIQSGRIFLSTSTDLKKVRVLGQKLKISTIKKDHKTGYSQSLRI